MPASTEAILRRFTRTASHPVYQAMLEVGRAQKTIFVARYLRDRDLQREIQEGLNIVEGWNGANDIIFFGKSGELSSNRRDQQELSVLALHLLQTALVFVNTLMIQDMLAAPEWADVLTEEDKRALTRRRIDRATRPRRRASLTRVLQGAAEARARPGSDTAAGDPSR
ncbi:transposase [Streptomyces sp. NBC_00846]|uniref:Tn3 family transposase n=1 Tax=Streptomyces sp. NBC_00846 TaxID=2975849 RepID=UPI0038701357|nr:transposase [Streptomyces sp. NBC_00846]